jgi:hypothetical protein
MRTSWRRPSGGSAPGLRQAVRGVVLPLCSSSDGPYLPSPLQALEKQSILQRKGSPVRPSGKPVHHSILRWIAFSRKPVARSRPPNETPSEHAGLPIEALQPFDQVEMPVPAQDGEVMLSTQRRNPGVVGRNWGASLFNSIVSNSRSIKVLIRAVSLLKCRRLPANFILVFCRAGDLASSFSATASLTNWRKGILCSAAFALARRKRGSGISNVVFMA